LRNNKAPGIDLIPAELVKFAGQEYVKHLHQLIAKIWITETIPEEWYLSIVCPIHKKGDVMVRVYSNYRRISLLCIAYKIFSNILFNRLSPCVEGIIGDYQCGFRQGRSTYDQIFTIRQILENVTNFKSKHIISPLTSDQPMMQLIEITYIEQWKR
jgi:sorting nexin-29